MASPDSRIALVDASGSGTSTIVNLLLRFYDPAGGTIVLQDSLLFGTSLRDNIA